MNWPLWIFIASILFGVGVIVLTLLSHFYILLTLLIVPLMSTWFWRVYCLKSQ
jgi:hypothetical protein